jgi:DNA-binding ferritin-like protein
MLSKLAADFRFMQFYAHNAHNLIKGSTFFQDHGFLGELYPKYTEIYDGIVERIIGADENIDLIKINQIAFETMKQAGITDDPKKIFINLLNFEEYVCNQIEELVQGYSEGTRQMLGTIADESEVRQYKLKQRIK